MDAVCVAKTFFDGTERMFEWAPPDGWIVLEGPQARELYSSAGSHFLGAPVSAEYLNTIQYAIIRSNETFSTNIIVRFENKRFGYQAADLDILKKQLEDIFKSRGAVLTVEKVSLLTRNDGKRVLEMVLDYPSEGAKQVQATIHVAGGQVQAILTAKSDVFSSDRNVLLNFIERVPYSSYATAQPLIESEQWYVFLFKTFVGASIAILLYYGIAHLWKIRKESKGTKTKTPEG